MPWRDPHTVPPDQLAEVIAYLKEACDLNPDIAELRICLGMAYAMNYDLYQSMDALEEATGLDADHFFARFKYAELFFRLRALPRAEQETLQALRLAGNASEMSLARKQLQEIRRLINEGTQKPAWVKPLAGPVVLLLALFVTLSAVVVYLR